MAKKAARRRKPRKRADNLHQVRQMKNRYSKLLDKAIAEAGVAMRRTAKYRQKLAYYSGRELELERIEHARQEAELQTLRESAGRREPRAVDLD